MADNQKLTLFQRLEKAFSSDSKIPIDYQSQAVPQTPSYNLDGNNVIYRTKDKKDYEQKLMELRQAMAFAGAFRRATLETVSMEQQNQTMIQMMYRDADIMDAYPLIGAALDITTEETCCMGRDGRIVNVQSKSDRIRAILEDLLVNRLSINTTLPLIARDMLKYGNCYMLHNISQKNGIIGWIELPVAEIYRMDHGQTTPFEVGLPSTYYDPNNGDDATSFVWIRGTNASEPFRNYQMSHFRLLYETICLPYGTSMLNKARRHWRMLSQMEDMMLLYRLERSIERRVFKVNVAAIAPDDVKAYVQEVMNNNKRSAIVDPATGQLDLRKTLLSVSDDYYVPVRSSDDPSEITSLPGAQNLTATDDIEYVLDLLCAALGVPKPYLNFKEEKGEGNNLAALDIRFAKRVNRIQQCLLMELNKLCVIHLKALGFDDEITNFNLSMNNPSLQAMTMELDAWQKKITLAKDAVTPQGEGLPVMSLTTAWKEIMGWSDKEIQENLESMRLEKAIFNELEGTQNVITKTGVFSAVDNIYGNPNASAQPQQQGNGEEGGPGGSGFGGGGFGGALDMGGMDMGGAEGMEGMEDMGDEADMSGAEGEMPMDDAAAAEEAPTLNEGRKRISAIDDYLDRMVKNSIENKKKEQEEEAINEFLMKERKNTSMLKEISNEIDEWRLQD